jgi:heat shock protein HslJ
MSTMMSCPAMEQAGAFKTALLNAKIYKNNTQSLELISNKGETLIELKALSSIPEEGLYRIKYLNNGKKAVISVTYPITIQLATDGKMEGSTGCNQYSTSYTIKQELITIGFPATTRQMCPPELMEQEQQFLNALPKSFKIARNGEKWEIRDENGALLFDMAKE